MAAISTASFVFRDFIRDILPTIIGACLFVPLIRNVSPDALVIAGIILGYLISPLIHEVAYYTYKYLPFIRKKLKEYEYKRKWCAANWDQGRLFYSLNKDDKEYVFLSGGYAYFYRLISFYLFVYFVINLLSLREALNSKPLDTWWCVARSVETAMMGGWKMPTIAVLIISPILSSLASRRYFLEYNLLFFENGSYAMLAEAEQREKGGMALSIWGKVIYSGKPATDLNVTLIVDNRTIYEAQTNQYGEFQFVKKFRECVNRDCKLCILTTVWQFEGSIEITETTIPRFEIHGP